MKCEYFLEEQVEVKSKTLRSGRNPIKPTFRIYTYCSHPNSKHPKRDIRTTDKAICNGNINQCDIPENERDNHLGA